jgi:SepF-like predicted cell division protein (DUF552 family)
LVVFAKKITLRKKSNVMDIAKTLQKIADELGGSFTEYSDNNLIVTVPTSDGRFQGITTYILEHDGKKVLEIASRVCEENHEGIDYKKLLKMNQDLTYSKIVIFDGYIQLAAEVLVEHTNDVILKDIVEEVGHTADKIEFELTGKDIH